MGLLIGVNKERIWGVQNLVVEEGSKCALAQAKDSYQASERMVDIVEEI